MSPHIIVDLNELQATLKRLNRAYRNKRNNERPLVSRNKREGWLFIRVKTLSAKGPSRICIRTKVEELALRNRKRTGAQYFAPKYKYRSKARLEAEMAAIGTRMVERS